MSRWMKDVMFAGRQLRKSPGFALMAILTLAFGICATTAIFSIVEGVLLRPLPFPEQASLVTVGDKINGALDYGTRVPQVSALVATGLYGTHSFRVSQRTTEIGVRMALGATRRQVLTMVMRESFWVLVAGLAAGLPLTYFAMRPLKSMLYQLSPFDPASFAVAVAAMVTVAICSGLLPARRAARLEPMQALRSE